MQSAAGEGGQAGPALPGGHDDHLPLAPQREAVWHAPLVLTVLHLRASAQNVTARSSKTLHALSNGH